MLIHICCSVDSHYFLQELKKLHPDRELIGFFYNPNIHPYEEYRLRFEDVQRSCDALGIELLEDGYDEESWIKEKLHLESAPEGGDRCRECFIERLDRSAIKAKKLGLDEFTTTLMMSPKKSFEILKNEGEMVAHRYGLEFFALDLKKQGGTQRQFELAKKDGLYKQNYCGCLFGLVAQREAMKKEPIETYSYLTRQILPNSFEEKREFYKKSQNKNALVLKKSFVNYRLLRGYIKSDGRVIDPHILYFSTQKQKVIKSGVEKLSEHIGFLPKSNSYIVDIDILNKVSEKNFTSLRDFRCSPISIDEELAFREMVCGRMSTSPIFLVEHIDFNSKYESFIDSVSFEDVSENLTMI
ncbi:MAG: epoxyqueuosine reductase QueH [Campylobacterales bacterium]